LLLCRRRRAEGRLEQRFVARGDNALGRHDRDEFDRAFVAGVRGQLEPSQRFGVVLRNGQSLSVHLPDIELRYGVSRRRGTVEPRGCFLGVLINALAAQQHVGEVGLGSHEPLFGRALIPVEGDLEILRHTEAEAVEVADIALGEGIATRRNR
jgi:hypothetical protein